MTQRGTGVFLTLVIACSFTVPSLGYYAMPAPGSMSCNVLYDGQMHTIGPNAAKALWESTRTVCEGYYCNGNTGTAYMEFSLSQTCNTGCVDTQNSLNYCVCLADCPAEPGAPNAQSVDVCAQQTPCENGGTCTNTADESFTCTCPAGYDGDVCQIDLCDMYCMNGGTCSHDVTSTSGVRCDCPQGYQGARCEVAECTTNPCSNGGVCLVDSSSSSGYVCQCSAGFTGALCETALSCPGGWSQQGGACFKGFDMKMSYAEARGRCADHNAIVSTGKTDAQNTFVRGLIEGGMWLGLTDTAQEGSFVWSDGTPLSSSPSAYLNWKTDEPDNVHNEDTDADCVSLASSGKWFDIPCSFKKVFVCQINL